MTTYTVAVTVTVAASSPERALHVIQHALNRGTLDEEVVYVDAELVSCDEDGPNDDEAYDMERQR